MVSVGTEGAIFMWHMPEVCVNGKNEQEKAPE
jgi:hypothetical protein